MPLSLLPAWIPILADRTLHNGVLVADFKMEMLNARKKKNELWWCLHINITEAPHCNQELHDSSNLIVIPTAY